MAISVRVKRKSQGWDKKLNTVRYRMGEGASGGLKPLLQKIERVVIAPRKEATWAAAMVVSRTGELESSIKTFSGNRSAGISVKTSPGKSLVIPKAVTLIRGARKHQFKSKRATVSVRAHSRGGVKVGAHTRMNVGAPWGNIKKRKLIPTNWNQFDRTKIEALVKKYLETGIA